MDPKLHGSDLGHIAAQADELAAQARRIQDLEQQLSRLKKSPVNFIDDDAVKIEGLDPDIAGAVHALRQAGVETFESCQGGHSHAYPEPTIRFHGNQSEGLRALSAALTVALPVAELRRVWPVIQGEPTGPWWELTFRSQKTSEAAEAQLATLTARNQGTGARNRILTDEHRGRLQD